MKATALSAAAAVAALTLTACGSSSDSGNGTTTLHVAAAASLTSSFEEIATAYEAEHQGVQVDLQFAGSSDLATQIDNGAQIDVFASADQKNMDKVKDAVDGEPTIFATNTLTIITEPGNPKEITDLKDLESKDLAVVVCAPRSPAGPRPRPSPGSKR